VVRLLVVDDYPLIRDGIRHAVRERDTAFEYAEASDVRSAMRLLGEQEPQVVLVDLPLDDGSDGVEFVEYLRRHHPTVRILVMSQAPTADIVHAVRTGAHGYLSKAATAAEVSQAVVDVLNGPVLPPELAAAIVSGFRQSAEQPVLTAREQDVLRCLAKGYDNREIADELGIAVRTVNRHLDAVRTKVGTRRRSQLARFAREWIG
jgi:DNA-binding NarL/FixJ family response regulator